MTEKEMQKLSRLQLLELLLEQTEKAERLEKQVEELQKQLEDRTILLNRAGSIAKASLEINHIFEDAQRAADQYLDNIRRLYRLAEQYSKEQGYESAGKDQPV